MGDGEEEDDSRRLAVFDAGEDEGLDEDGSNGDGWRW